MFGFFGWIFNTMFNFGTSVVTNVASAGLNFMGGLATFVMTPVFGIFAAAGVFAKGLFHAGAVAVKALGAIVKIVGNVVIKAIRATTRIMGAMVRRAGAMMIENHPVWEFILTRHFNWKRALVSQEDFDAEVKRLETEIGEDADGNGIPDAYDEAVLSPADDVLGIKYPSRLLVENDYIRLMPRARGALLSPVPRGSKGIVRETTLDTRGAWAWIKWNQFSRGEDRPAPLHRINQMDAHLLGHISRNSRATV